MSNALLHITLASHNFKVTKLTPRGNFVVNEFASKYVLKGFTRLPNGRYICESLKVFAAATKDRTEYRFHINQYKDFLDHIKYHHITENLYTVETLPIIPGLDIDVKVKPEWKIREDQIPVIDYLKEENGNRAKFVDAQTGSGKTVMSLFSIADYNKRAIIIIKPMFIEKWVEDLEKTYKLSKGDVMVVKGSAHLIGLLDLAKNDELKAKFIIISNKTMQNWIKLYEQFREGTVELGYDTLPENLFQDLNAGIRLIDEVHMDLHLTFKIDLYTNVAKSISLSATLLSNDPFIAKMQECMYPTRLRYMQPKLNRYINSHVVYYQFKDPSKIRTTEYGATNYSHTALEKSIIKHVPTLMNYFNLIDYIIQIGFIKHIRKKKKLLIFAATVDMCTVIVNHFSKKYPQYNVKRYVAEDSYEDNLMGSDICVSTLGSSGTAVDIPNLTNVILTVAVDSIQSNIQALGRLRKLDNNDKVEFHYFACQDIPKHMEYAYRKQEMLEKRAATFSEVHSRHVV